MFFSSCNNNNNNVERNNTDGQTTLSIFGAKNPSHHYSLNLTRLTKSSARSGCLEYRTLLPREKSWYESITGHGVQHPGEREHGAEEGGGEPEQRAHPDHPARPGHVRQQEGGGERRRGVLEEELNNLPKI